MINFNAICTKYERGGISFSPSNEFGNTTTKVFIEFTFDELNHVLLEMRSVTPHDKTDCTLLSTSQYTVLEPTFDISKRLSDNLIIFGLTDMAKHAHKEHSKSFKEANKEGRFKGIELTEMDTETLEAIVRETLVRRN